MFESAHHYNKRWSTKRRILGLDRIVIIIVLESTTYMLLEAFDKCKDNKIDKKTHEDREKFTIYIQKKIPFVSVVSETFQVLLNHCRC